jgi:hypothetical protein
MQSFMFYLCLVALLLFCILAVTKHFQYAGKLKEEIRAKRIQARFALVRNRLMRLVMEDKVDVHSKTFLLLYGVNTAMMRFYESPVNTNITKELVCTQAADHHPIPEQEIQHWSPQIAQLFQDTADAVGHIVIEHSWYWKLAFAVRKSRQPAFSPWVLLHNLRFLHDEHLQREEQQREQMLEEIQQTLRQTQETVARYAPATGKSSPLAFT